MIIMKIILENQKVITYKQLTLIENMEIKNPAEVGQNALEILYYMAYLQLTEKQVDDILDKIYEDERKENNLPFVFNHIQSTEGKVTVADIGRYLKRNMI